MTTVSNLDLLYLAISFDQFVTDLKEHSKGQVGFLHSGQDFRFIDIATGQQGMDHVVRIALHRVDILDLLGEQIGESIDSCGLLLPGRRNLAIGQR